MVDLHSHILYGWDDGAEDLDVSLAMLRQAEEGGTDVIAATPHMFWGGERVQPGVVRERVEEINAAAKEGGLSARVVVGTEMPAMWDAANVLFHGGVVPLNDGHAVLFEPPFNALPVRFEELVFQMRMKGWVPLFAHPERCRPFLQDPRLYETMVPEDVAIQLTTTSLVGDFGADIQAFAWDLLRGSRPVIVSSDAHNAGSRSPGMAAARTLVAGEMGEAFADLVFEENPRALIEDRPVRSGAPTVASSASTGLLDRVRNVMRKR